MPKPIESVPATLEVLASDGTMILATWRNVVIARWLQVPTVAEIQAMRVRSRSFSARVGPFAAINFVEAHDATSMPDDARTEVAAVQREFAKQQRCLATIIEGAGFWAATVRGVASGLALVSRVRFPQRVFADLGAAVAWVVNQAPELGVDALVPLTQALAAVRAIRVPARAAVAR